MLKFYNNDTKMPVNAFNVFMGNFEYIYFTLYLETLKTSFLNLQQAFFSKASKHQMLLNI